LKKDEKKEGERDHDPSSLPPYLCTTLWWNWTMVPLIHFSYKSCIVVCVLYLNTHSRRRNNRKKVGREKESKN
jgi:hypothetical protein